MMLFNDILQDLLGYPPHPPALTVQTTKAQIWPDMGWATLLPLPYLSHFVSHLYPGRVYYYHFQHWGGYERAVRKQNSAVVGKVFVGSELRFKPSFLSSQCCPYNRLSIKFPVLWFFYPANVYCVLLLCATHSCRAVGIQQ